MYLLHESMTAKFIRKFPVVSAPSRFTALEPTLIHCFFAIKLNLFLLVVTEKCYDSYGLVNPVAADFRLIDLMGFTFVSVLLAKLFKIKLSGLV